MFKTYINFNGYGKYKVSIGINLIVKTMKKNHEKTTKKHEKTRKNTKKIEFSKTLKKTQKPN